MLGWIKKSLFGKAHQGEVVVILSADVLSRIHRAVSGSGIEEGGKLLGRVVVQGHSLTVRVQASLDSGPRVSNSSTHLLPDGEYQESLFRLLECYDPEIEHLGTWHSHHCNGLGELSSGDIRGYCESVNSPNYNLDIFYALLVTRDPVRIEDLKHYLFVRGEKDFLELPSTSVQVQDERYPLASLLLEAEHAALAGRRSTAMGDVRGHEDRVGGEASTEVAARVLAEDRDWLSQYPGAAMVRGVRSGILSWKWKVGIPGSHLDVRLTYPLRHSGTDLMLHVSRSGDVVVERRVALNRSRHSVIDRILAEVLSTFESSDPPPHQRQPRERR